MRTGGQPAHDGAMTAHQPSATPGATGSLATLRRRRDGRLVAGVAAGLADYLGLDPTVVRLGLVALTLLGGAGVPVYAAAWVLVPEEGATESIAAGLLHGRAR